MPYTDTECVAYLFLIYFIFTCSYITCATDVTDFTLFYYNSLKCSIIERAEAANGTYYLYNYEIIIKGITNKLQVVDCTLKLTFQNSLIYFGLRKFKLMVSKENKTNNYR